MILLNLKVFHKLPLRLKPLYLSYVNHEILTKMKEQDLAFSQALNQYSVTEIKEAFDECFIKGDFLIVPDKSKEDKILRLLEYGGQGVKASNLVTIIRNKFEKDFREGGFNV